MGIHVTPRRLSWRHAPRHRSRRRRRPTPPTPRRQVPSPPPTNRTFKYTDCCRSLHENTQLLQKIRHRLFLLWGPLEEGISSSPPKPIRKPRHHTHHISTKKIPYCVRFSDEICFDDDSSSSLDAKWRGAEDEGAGGGGVGGKIVRESEAEFGVRRWRMFGTRLDA